MSDLSDAETWLYHLGDVNAARAREIAASNADLVVTEWADYSRGESPYTSDFLDIMRGEDAKTILSYISIGEAEPYRYYWDPAWETADGRPDWIGEANPEWVDNIRVRFWQDEWQAVIFDYAEKIVENGFDGLYLDIVSAYEFWEKKGRAPEELNLRSEMADFVAELRAVVQAKRDEIGAEGDFFIVGQNALELIRNKTYRDAIDGVAREDLRFYYEYGAPEDFAPWPRSEYTYFRDLLAKAEGYGKATFVVEYVPEGMEAKAEKLLKAEAGDLGGIGTPIFVATERDLTSLPAQPSAIDNGVFPPFGPEKVSPPPPASILTGTKKADTIKGTAAADLIDARAGADTVYANKGADTVKGGSGHDLLKGAGGNDLLRGNAGQDDLFGQLGHDTLNGGTQADHIAGGRGNDLLIGGGGGDELFGGPGADTLMGGKGDDLMNGGKGPDVFRFARRQGEDEIEGFDRARDLIDLAEGMTYTTEELPEGLYLDFAGPNGVLLLGLTLAEFDPASVV